MMPRTPKSKFHWLPAVTASALGLATVLPAAAELVANQALGLRHPAGFQITQFAGRELAPDIESLTLDSLGRVVVSGRGWIKRLDDTDADGRADNAVIFAETATGARGMVFLGNDLYCLADGAFGRLLDSNADGVADGPPQRFFDFGFGAEGVSSLRRGPDGAWYVMAGRGADLGPAHWNHPGSPIRNPEGGALLHIAPDLSRSEVVAHGFLHAPHFDFHASGAILTYDHGYARDAFLPWLAYPRLFQVAHGAHHGWRGRSLPRPYALPEYDPGQVPILWSANAGAPTGMTFYRHHQFPTDFRGGLFTADWENGRINFVKLQPFQSGFTAAVTPFIEPIGRNGFTPTALAVGPDGSLYIATGGRRTGSGVYRVQYTQLDPKTGRLPDQPVPFLSNLDAVLRAPQRLESWSRNKWLPLALRDGRRSFEQVAMSVADPEAYKLVALEVLTELFGGINRWEANVTAKSAFPSVRAMTAWSIARHPFEGSLVTLQELLRDDSALVLRAALEVYVDNAAQLPAVELLRVTTGQLEHLDPRVSEAAITLASRLPAEQWQQLTKQAVKQSPTFRLGVARALLLRQPVTQQPNELALREGLAVLREPEKGTPLLGVTALKLVSDSFGGPNHEQPSAEAFANYELRLRPADYPALAAEALAAIRPLFPTGNPIVDAELARALGQLEDGDPATPARMLGAFGAQSPVPSDIHYLACIARLNPNARVAGLTNLAEVLLWLDNKTGEPGTRAGLNWRPRVVEIASRLIRLHPEIGTTLLQHRNLPEPAHAWLADALNPEQRTAARQRFLAASAHLQFQWNAEVIGLLAEAPSDELANRLRAQWSRIDLHDALVQGLAQRPDAVDRAWLIGALTSEDFRTTSAALAALAQLEEPAPQSTIVEVMRVLHRAVTRPQETAARKAAVGWLARHGGWSGVLEESADDRRSLELTYRPLFAWFAGQHPLAAAQISGLSEEDFEHWEKQLKEAPWSLGKSDRGASLFKHHRCAECHAGGTGFGPTLAGFTEVLSPAGVMRTVLYPHLDVAPGAGVAELFLHDGSTRSGIVVFESLDHLILRQENGETIRLLQTDLARRRVTTASLMPVGLLKGVSARGLADLHAYLQTMR